MRWITKALTRWQFETSFFYFMAETKEKKPRKSPVPANAERITEGALKLPIDERIELNQKLSQSIKEEMEAAKVKFDQLQMKLNGVK